MSEALYERYKDALRRGHVATLRGRLDAALVAYHEAATIAPERPLPHSSLGGVLHRMGREEESLVAYGAALERAPRDEVALAGRADVLRSLGRRVEAAETLDRLAEVLEAADRLREACDTARRALELAESRARRRHVEALVRRLDALPVEAAVRAVLERAAAVLEREGDAAASSPAAAATAHDADAEAEPPVVAEAAQPPDGAVLLAAAEAAVDAGDRAGARDTFLAAAAAHRAAHHFNAAIDACYLALAIVPADPDLHLALAELYLEQGWRGPAADKLVLLSQLAALTDDRATRDRVCALAAAHLPDETRLAAACA